MIVTYSEGLSKNKKLFESWRKSCSRFTCAVWSTVTRIGWIRFPHWLIRMDEPLGSLFESNQTSRNRNRKRMFGKSSLSIILLSDERYLLPTGSCQEWMETVTPQSHLELLSKRVQSRWANTNDGIWYPSIAIIIIIDARFAVAFLQARLPFFLWWLLLLFDVLFLANNSIRLVGDNSKAYWT